MMKILVIRINDDESYNFLERGLTANIPGLAQLIIQTIPFGAREI
jgi:hypothetical protein